MGTTPTSYEIGLTVLSEAHRNLPKPVDGKALHEPY